jgi:AcrR family transcriptional regulator
MSVSGPDGPARVRMTGAERRAQLTAVAREVFAEKGFAGASVEEVAHRGQVSKPVVYEHFGGKDGLYAAVVNVEMSELLGRISRELSAVDVAHPRELLAHAAIAFLGYVEERTDGFRVLVRDSPVSGSSGFASLLGELAGRVEAVLERDFARLDMEVGLAALYSQALVGMVVLSGQWWLEAGGPDREEVAAHLVNLVWHGLSGIDPVGEILFGYGIHPTG